MARVVGLRVVVGVAMLEDLVLLGEDALVSASVMLSSFNASDEDFSAFYKKEMLLNLLFFLL